MRRRGRCGLSLFIALLAFAGAAWGQGRGPMLAAIPLAEVGRAYGRLRS
jgi:hypothetical protein